MEQSNQITAPVENLVDDLVGVIRHIAPEVSDLGPDSLAERESRPRVFPKTDREYVVEWQGVFTRYRDGLPIPTDLTPKG